MIAVDSSSWIAYLAGASGPDVAAALAERRACLPPVVFTELLGDPKLPRAVAQGARPGWPMC